MSYIVPKEIPNRCGRCPCFHAEHPMYCQAVKADKNKRIYAPYGENRPDWCPLIKIPPPAQPKRGKWNRLDMDTLNCNKCGATFVLNQGSEKMHFCPNCRADMREETE